MFKTQGETTSFISETLEAETILDIENNPLLLILKKGDTTDLSDLSFLDVA